MVDASDKAVGGDLGQPNKNTRQMHEFFPKCSAPAETRYTLISVDNSCFCVEKTRLVIAIGFYSDHGIEQLEREVLI